MKHTIQVQPVLTYTSADGRKYHERAILYAGFNNGVIQPLGMVDVEPLFYDDSEHQGGDFYRSILDGTAVLVEMEITLKGVC